MESKIRLSNGLCVIACPQPQLHRAHVAAYVRVGSRFEDASNNGISHFLEHMMYRGTRGLPTAHEVNLAFERLGGYLYAATHADFGIFSVTLPPECLDAASSLFGDVLCCPEFRDIDVEKGIVSEEILEDLDDEGRQVNADNLSRSLIFPKHPLGFTITGDEERVRSFDEAMLRRHHGRHYAAASVVLTYSGAIDADAVFRLADRDFSRMAPGEPIPAQAPTTNQKRARVKVVENVSSQTDLRISFRTISENAKERPALDMLMRILDDGMSTRLYHRICDEKGLCYDVSAGYDGYEDTGVVDFAAGVQHARALVLTGEVFSLLEELAQRGPTNDELEKAKRRHRWELHAMLDSAEDVAGFFAGGELFGRQETPQQRIEALDKVTTRDVQAMVRSLAQPENLNVIAVGLLENDEDRRFIDFVKSWKGVPTD